MSWLSRAVCALALVATMALAPATASAAPRAKSCGDLTLGTAVFSRIKATGVSCASAKRLIDKATLSESRDGNVYWTYRGWEWSIQGINEMTNRLRGKRGKQRITATWSAT